MPLDPARLVRVRHLDDGGLEAACPACAEAGADSHARHLRVWADGRFACAAHPGDRDHRRRIWALAQDGSRPLGPRPRVITADRRIDALAAACRAARGKVLARLWSLPDIEAASPETVPPLPVAQARAMVSLFHPQDVVWTGRLTDSGSQRHALRFRTAAQWLASGGMPGPRICSCSFRPGVISRSLRTVRRRRFLVAESDCLSLEEQGALARWAISPPTDGGGGLRLRAVVFTGGRSLHLWFDFPGLRAFARLAVMLPAWGADPSLLSPVQPVRVPGWHREDSDRLVRLLYLDSRP